MRLFNRVSLKGETKQNDGAFFRSNISVLCLFRLPSEINLLKITIVRTHAAITYLVCLLIIVTDCLFNDKLQQRQHIAYVPVQTYGYVISWHTYRSWPYSFIRYPFTVGLYRFRSSTISIYVAILSTSTSTCKLLVLVVCENKLTTHAYSYVVRYRNSKFIKCSHDTALKVGIRHWHRIITR